VGGWSTIPNPPPEFCLTSYSVLFFLCVGGGVILEAEGWKGGSGRPPSLSRVGLSPGAPGAIFLGSEVTVGGAFKPSSLGGGPQ